MADDKVQMLDKGENKDEETSVFSPQTSLEKTFSTPSPAGQTPTPVTTQPQVKLGSKGTGFVGVRRLLGASAGSRLGQQVGGRVQQAGQQARSGIAGARQEFQQKAGRAGEQMQQQAGAAKEAVSGILSGVGKGFVRPEYTGSLKDKYDAVYKRMRDDRARTPEQREIEDAADKNKFLQSLTPEEKQQYEAIQSTSFMPSAEQQAAFQQIATGQYTGPRELTGTEKLASKAYEAQQLGKLAGTTAGRQELLQQQFGGRGGYGSKLSALDALILGKTASKQLAQAKAGTMGLEKELATGQMAAGEQARTLQEQAAGLGKEALGQIERGAAGLKTAAEKRFKELKTGQKQDIEAAIEGLRTGEISEDVASKLGLKQGQFLGQFSEQELRDIVSESELPTLATSASKEDVARMEALKKLGGGIAQAQLAPSLSPFKIEEAGKYDPTKSIKFAETAEGKSAFEAAQQAQKTPLEEELRKERLAESPSSNLETIKENSPLLYRQIEASNRLSKAMMDLRNHENDPFAFLFPGDREKYQAQINQARTDLEQARAERSAKISGIESKLARTLKIKKAEPK